MVLLLKQTEVQNSTVFIHKQGKLTTEGSKLVKGRDVHVIIEDAMENTSILC